MWHNIFVRFISPLLVKPHLAQTEKLSFNYGVKSKVGQAYITKFYFYETISEENKSFSSLTEFNDCLIFCADKF